MEFETGKHEYSLRDFIKYFNSKLPAFVQVTQGFLGDKSMETLDRGQIIRVERVVMQKRVIAQVINGSRRLVGKSLSIPVNYPKPFITLVPAQETTSRKQLDTGLQGNLCHLLKRRKPPFTVTCSEGKLSTSSSTTASMQSLCLLIKDTYEDLYILGNFISNEKLFLSVRSIPRHLQDVRISIIVGIKTQGKRVWQAFQQHMRKVIDKEVDFGRVDPNPEISIYETGEDVSDLTYSTPTEYCTIEMIYEGHQYGSLGVNRTVYSHVQSNMYEIIPAEYGMVGKARKEPCFVKSSSRKEKEVPPPQSEYSAIDDLESSLENPPVLPPIPNIDGDSTIQTHSRGVTTAKYKVNQRLCESSHCVQSPRREEKELPVAPSEYSAIADLENLSGNPPVLTSRPIINEEKTTQTHSRITTTGKYQVNRHLCEMSHSVKSSRRKEKELPPIPVDDSAIGDSKGLLGNPPVLPPRPNINEEPTIQTHSKRETPDKCQVNQQLCEGSHSLPETSQHYAGFYEKDDTAARPLLPKPLLLKKRAVRGSSTRKQDQTLCLVADMSIKDVGRVLEELRLSSYVRQFSDAAIDGAILNELNEGILCEEFNMRKYEAIKVMHFVRKGHIPK